jgi:hypothetical protein
VYSFETCLVSIHWDICITEITVLCYGPVSQLVPLVNVVCCSGRCLFRVRFVPHGFINIQE